MTTVRQITDPGVQALASIAAILKSDYQVRDQNYAYVICLGLSPFDAHCWVISKDLLRVHVLGHTPQHAGKAGTDTFWLSFPATNPASWLSPCGGTLAQAFDVLKWVGRSRS